MRCPKKFRKDRADENHPGAWNRQPPWGAPRPVPILQDHQRVGATPHELGRKVRSATKEFTKQKQKDLLSRGGRMYDTKWIKMVLSMFMWNFAACSWYSMIISTHPTCAWQFGSSALATSTKHPRGVKREHSDRTCCNAQCCNHEEGQKCLS